MATADELKTKGNELFKEGDYVAAIDLYSQAITGLDDNDSNQQQLAVLYSNRSAAYLKHGQAFKALQDASKCIELNPDFAKGYHRMGSALHALRRFNEAMEVFQTGLDKFPGNEGLLRGLEAVETDKNLASNIRRKSATATRRVSSITGSKNKNNAPETVTEFVKTAKADIQLQMLALQAQMEILDSLSKMSDEQKRSMLFGLLDKDGNGYIDARELADGVRKGNEDLSFAESLERAIDFVALFDDSHDGKLNPEEFNNFLDSMVRQLGVTFHELSEFLVLQTLFGVGNNPVEEMAGEIVAEEIDEEVKNRTELYDVMSDERMEALFYLFDTSGDGFVDFSEVAVGLYKLCDNMEQSTKAAATLMLMVDKDDLHRTLDYEQFTTLMMNFCALSNKKFSEVADSLTLTMALFSGEMISVTPEELAELVVADELYERANMVLEEEKEAEQVFDTLQYAKLHRLFDMWDLDHNGKISYQELLTGMRKFQGAMDLEESIQRAALTMLAFDEDGDQTLDRVEFAKAISTYANTVETDTHEFIDFMVVTSALKDDNNAEAAYIKSISPSATAQIKTIQDRLALEDVDEEM